MIFIQVFDLFPTSKNILFYLFEKKNCALYQRSTYEIYGYRP